MVCPPLFLPFNRPHLGGKELGYIAQAHANGQLAGDGSFTQQCQGWLEQRTGCRKALLTHSCTAALEMAVILADIQPGDEVIMPSYTFVSTANAFVLRGGVPVFVDIEAGELQHRRGEDRSGDHSPHPSDSAGEPVRADAGLRGDQRHRRPPWLAGDRGRGSEFWGDPA